MNDGKSIWSDAIADAQDRQENDMGTVSMGWQVTADAVVTHADGTTDQDDETTEGAE